MSPSRSGIFPGAAAIPQSLQFPTTTVIVLAQFSATLSDGTSLSASSNPALGTTVAPILGNAPGSLTFVQQPTAAIAGVALTPAVTVSLPGGGTGAVTLTSNPAGVTVTASAVSGVATFNNLIFNTSGSYTLTATTTGFASATSSPLTIAAAAPGKLSFLQPATNGTAGIALANPVTVQIQDALAIPPPQPQASP